MAVGKRKVYEAEVDGCSVIVWEAGKGTRVVYPTDHAAETAGSWLIEQANRFHAAKEANAGDEDENMVSLVCYGDQLLTEFAFIRGYLGRMRKIGLEIQEDLTRIPKEFW